MRRPSSDIGAWLEPLLAGRDGALVSEAGCPAVADPGAQIVAAAHQRGTARATAGGSIVTAAGADGVGTEWPAVPLSRLSAGSRRRTREPAPASPSSATRAPARPSFSSRRPIAAPRCSMRSWRPAHRPRGSSVAVDLTGPSEFVRTRTIAEWKRSAAAAGGATPDRVPAARLRARASQGHGRDASGSQQTDAALSTTVRGRRPPCPAQAPPRHAPVAGSYRAPWVAQIRNSASGSKNSPGCQSSSIATCAQRFRYATAIP